MVIYSNQKMTHSGVLEIACVDKYLIMPHNFGSDQLSITVSIDYLNVSHPNNH